MYTDPEVFHHVVLHAAFLWKSVDPVKRSIRETVRVDVFVWKDEADVNMKPNKPHCVCLISINYKADNICRSEIRNRVTLPTMRIDSRDARTPEHTQYLLLRVV